MSLSIWLFKLILARSNTLCLSRSDTKRMHGTVTAKRSGNFRRTQRSEVRFPTISNSKIIVASRSLKPRTLISDCQTVFSWLIVYLCSRVGEEIGVQDDMTKRDIFMAGVSNSHTCGSHKKRRNALQVEVWSGKGSEGHSLLNKVVMATL